MISLGLFACSRKNEVQKTLKSLFSLIKSDKTSHNKEGCDHEVNYRHDI